MRECTRRKRRRDGDHYDVYDVQSFGNTNNDLGSRATPAQAGSYSLIVHDAGRSDFHPIPTGNSRSAKVDQATWYRNWLSNAPFTELESITLWVIGEDVVETMPLNPLMTTDMRAFLATGDESTHPELQGVSQPWVAPKPQNYVDLANGRRIVFPRYEPFRLNGGCPNRRDYDGLQLVGTTTHWYSALDYQFPAFPDAAITVRAQPQVGVGPWNTIMMCFAWSDIIPFFQAAPRLAQVFLNGDQPGGGVLSQGCLQLPDPTDMVSSPWVGVTQLHQCVPNPFNSRTVIHFDLARESQVQLNVYDVAGRLVRTLINAKRGGQRHAVRWDGRDDRGNPVASGVYFYRLHVGDFTDAKKLVVMK